MVKLVWSDGFKFLVIFWDDYEKFIVIIHSNLYSEWIRFEIEHQMSVPYASTLGYSFLTDTVVPSLWKYVVFHKCLGI